MNETLTEPVKDDIPSDIVTSAGGYVPSSESRVEEVKTEKPVEVETKLESTKTTPEDDILRQKAQSFDNLLANPDFQRWYVNLGSPQTPSPTPQTTPVPEIDLTDEDFQSVLSDKRKFKEYINGEVFKMAKEVVGPAIQKSYRDFLSLKSDLELDEVIKKYPDFLDLNDKGLIEPIIMKYPTIGFENAYHLAKVPHYENQSRENNNRMMSEKKFATVEKGGVFSKNKLGTLKVKNREEAMAIALRMASEGKQPPEFEIGG